MRGSSRRAGMAVALLIAAGLFTQSRALAQDQPQSRPYRDCEECPEMVPIPPGSFLMGAAPGEEERAHVPKPLLGISAPQHEVTIEKAFAIGKYLVTRAEFAAFTEATRYRAESKCGIMLQNPATHRNEWQERADLNWRFPGYRQTKNDPVMCVNWDDAMAYIDWLSKRTRRPYRLPTEAEWEYAARAGSTGLWFWGDDPSQACRFANVRDATKAELHKKSGGYAPPYFDCAGGYAESSPVGSFAPNAFGLHDMLGNAFQWVADCWNPGFQGAPTDGSAWLAGDCRHRVLRGASWATALFAVRLSYRSKGESGEGFTMRQYIFSFRVAGPVENMTSDLVPAEEPGAMLAKK